MLEIFLVLPSPDSLSLSLVLPTCMCVCVWVCVGYAGFSFAFPFTIFFLRLLILFWPKRQQQRQQQAQQKAQQSVHWAWTRSTIVPDSQATFSLSPPPHPLSLSLPSMWHVLFACLSANDMLQIKKGYAWAILLRSASARALTAA